MDDNETPVADTREAWLNTAVEALRPLFDEAEITLPAKVRVSVGWPGGKGAKKNAIGQCWATGAVSDGVAAIFISPVLLDPKTILVTLVHELVHAADDCKSGHRGAFVKMARRVGLAKPWTSTPPTDALVESLEPIAESLGQYDHGTIAVGSRKGTQGTRMLKVVCGDCGCVLRMTAKWINESGLPTCGCGGEMEAA